jgi:hypothetical protein
MTASAQAPAPETLPPLDPLPQRIWDNVRTGNLGPAPVVLALGVVVLIFGFTAQNFWSPANFQNIITTMAGPTLIAYGVVFVLLIGEIDLSVAYVSGVAGVVVAQLQRPDAAHLPWWLCVLLAIAATTAIGAFQGSVVALVGVPSFVVTLAGYEIWNGVIFKGLPGVITIQSQKINDFSYYLFSPTAGLDHRCTRERCVRRWNVVERLRGSPSRNRPTRPPCVPVEARDRPACCLRHRRHPQQAGLWRDAAGRAPDGGRSRPLDVRREADDVRAPCLRGRR